MVVHTLNPLVNRLFDELDITVNTCNALLNRIKEATDKSEDSMVINLSTWCANIEERLVQACVLEMKLSAHVSDKSLLHEYVARVEATFEEAIKLKKIYNGE